METRTLGGTGFDVTTVGLGTWTVGPFWGESSDRDAHEAVRAALESGSNFLDTAEVYGDGRAERVIGDVLGEPDPDERVYVATKAAPDDDGGHSYEGLAESVAGSSDRLGVDAVDLLQLHCPDTGAFYDPTVFDALERLREEGAIGHAGVSVETVEEGLKAVEYPVVESVQVIFNPFRQRPSERLFDAADRADVGVIVRVPLASGLFADAFDADTEFDDDDHRNAAKTEGVEAGVGPKGGETFAGVPFEAGLAAVDDLREYVPADATMAQFALRWVLDHDAVTTVIPGSTAPEHVRENAAAADLPQLSHRTHGAVRDVYEEHVAEHVHHRW